MTQGAHTAKVQDQEIELLSFRLGVDEYCVDIMSVREIRSWSKPTSLPHAPPHVCGVINLRGTVLPVVDLSVRLGMEPIDIDVRNVIIVVQINTHTVGLLVNAVSDILTLRTEQLQPPPETSVPLDQKYVDSLAIVDSRMVRVLNLAAVLPNLTTKTV